MNIPLTFFEAQTATGVGIQRHLEAVYKNRKPRFPEKFIGQILNGHIHSACAEFAFSKHFNLPWGFHVNRFHVDGDVAGVEVRWTPSPDLGLKVRGDDTGTIVMFTGAPPDMKFIGYCEADFAKRKDWSKDFGYGNPAYFVPCEELTNPEEFVL